MLLFLFPPLHHIHVLRGLSLFPFMCSCCVVSCPPSGTITIHMWLCNPSAFPLESSKVSQTQAVQSWAPCLPASRCPALGPQTPRPSPCPAVLRSARCPGQEMASIAVQSTISYGDSSWFLTCSPFSLFPMLAAALVQATIISLPWVIKSFHLDSLPIAFFYCSLKTGIWSHHLPSYSLRWLSIAFRIKTEALSVMNTHSMPRSRFVLPPPLCPLHAFQSIYSLVVLDNLQVNSGQSGWDGHP